MVCIVSWQADQRASEKAWRNSMPKYNIIILSLSNQEGMTARNGCHCHTPTAPGQSSGAAESCTRSGRRGSTKGRVDFSGRLSTQSFTIYVHNVHGEKYFKHFCFFYARRFFNIAVDSNPWSGVSAWRPDKAKVNAAEEAKRKAAEEAGTTWSRGKQSGSTGVFWCKFIDLCVSYRLFITRLTLLFQWANLAQAAYHESITRNMVKLHEETTFYDHHKCFKGLVLHIIDFDAVTVPTLTVGSPSVYWKTNVSLSLGLILEKTQFNPSFDCPKHGAFATFGAAGILVQLDPLVLDRSKISRCHG